jgi:hypothetical protein
MPESLEIVERQVEKTGLVVEYLSDSLSYPPALNPAEKHSDYWPAWDWHQVD